MNLVVGGSALAGLVMYARYRDCDPFSAGWVGARDQVCVAEPVIQIDLCSSATCLLLLLYLERIFSLKKNKTKQNKTKKTLVLEI